VSKEPEPEPEPEPAAEPHYTADHPDETADVYDDTGGGIVEAQSSVTGSGFGDSGDGGRGGAR
jgi:hypothetical protein